MATERDPATIEVRAPGLRAVIFDLFGVLTRAQSGRAVDAMVRSLGVGRPDVSSGPRPPRGARELTVEEHPWVDDLALGLQRTGIDVRASSTPVARRLFAAAQRRSVGDMARAAGSVRHVARAIVVACLVVAAAGPAGAVVIDRDTAYDPRDIEPERDFQPPDISSTTRRLATVDGRRIVAIVVRYYVRSATGRVDVRIDASGGPHVDHRMLIAAFADPGCWIWPKGDRDGRVAGKVGWRSERVACRVAARFLEPDKAIRWKVLAEASDGGFEPDLAPDDRGWYS